MRRATMTIDAQRPILVRVVRLLLLALAVFELAGCVMPQSPADLARNENHFYPARSRTQVYRAALTGLKTLGFQVVSADEGSAQIKTAPKVITATAYGGSYSAVAIENSIGWTISVVSTQGGAGLHAEPRGYSGGQVVLPTDMNGDYLQKLFDTLYGEIDNNLPPSR